MSDLDKKVEWKVVDTSKFQQGKVDHKKLKAEGYEEVRLIDTTDGTFMGKKEAAWLGLAGSTLLVGKK